MRFGVLLPQGCNLDLVGVPVTEQWSTIRDLAQAIDAGPYESVWVSDHLHTVTAPSNESTFEAWSMMAAFAACTSRVRLGQLCTCVGFRNPTYLAKMAACVDVMSGGRLEMGLGAGWFEDEWRAYGYGFPSAAERLDMLDEAVQIMRQLWTHGTATFAGRHFQVDHAISRPLPLQDGGIPLWIGGSGEKKTLRTAAKYARYTNFGTMPLDEFIYKSQILTQHCKDVGTDFDAITRSAFFLVTIGETEQDVADKIARLKAHYEPLMAPDALEGWLAQFTGGLIGTPEQIVEQLTKGAQAGVGYAIAYFADAAYDRTSMDLFASRVIPELVG